MIKSDRETAILIVETNMMRDGADRRDLVQQIAEALAAAYSAGVEEMRAAAMKACELDAYAYVESTFEECARQIQELPIDRTATTP